MLCDCNSTASKMDRNGPDWVRKNIDLLTGECSQNAEKLGHNIGTMQKIGIKLCILAHCRIAEGKSPTLIQRIAMNRAEHYFASKACRTNQKTATQNSDAS